MTWLLHDSEGLTLDKCGSSSMLRRDSQVENLVLGQKPCALWGTGVQQGCTGGLQTADPKLGQRLIKGSNTESPNSE